MVTTTNISDFKLQVSHTQTSGLKKELLLTNEVRDILQWFLFSVTCQIIDIFGATTNIINIICFIKQGFKDPVNVSLLGLAISDLGSLTTLIWTNICMTPAFSNADLPFDPVEFQYLTSAWPHSMFSRITSWITALITLERCLCITMPLKVKNLVTPRRVFIIIAIVYIVLISAIAPMYSVYKLGMKYFPDRNKTLLALITTNDRDLVETVSFTINIVILPACSFMIIIVCTVILVISLRKSRNFRKKSTSQTTGGSENRNQKVAKMVVMISALFISCFIPFTMIFVGILLEPELSIDGKYRNMILVLIGVGMILESINSSVNIFIYYHMSSRYRVVFRQLFCKDAFFSDKFI